MGMKKSLNEKKSVQAGRSLGRQSWTKFCQQKGAVAGLVFLVLMTALCAFLPLFSFVPSPNVQDISRITEGCSAQHWLGTDHLGRDLFSRLLYGGRITLLVGFVATGVSLLIGLLYGAVSGYLGGRWDALMMRGIDILFALPFMVLVIIFSLRIEPWAAEWTSFVCEWTGLASENVAPLMNLLPLFIAIGALSWLTLARIVRTEVLSLKERDFVQAARSLGLGHTRIIRRHILPSLLGPVIIYTTLAVPGVMLLESVLSFLGLGVRPPNSSWGTLIKEGADRLEVCFPLLLYPSLFFSLTLLALNFLGDGLRDALDPRQ